MRYVKSVKILGTITESGTDYNVAIFHFECDTDSDLPSVNDYVATNNTKIYMSSTAHVIDTNADYEMQSDGTWTIQTPGTATYTKSEIDTMISQIDLVRQGTEIEENADLNTFETIGAYYSPNSARTGTLYNRPWSGSGFKMIVWSISSTSKMQWIMPISNSADSIFFRSRTTSGWRPWYQLQGTAVTTINPYP